MLSRVFFGQARFALQLRIALTASIALLLWGQLSEVLSFSFAWREFAEFAGLGAWAVLAATCYAHLHAIGPRHIRTAMGVVVAVMGAGMLLQYAAQSETRNLLGQRATLGDLRPPAFRLAPLVSSEQFFERAEKAKVDQARTREPGSGGLFGDESLD